MRGAARWIVAVVLFALSLALTFALWPKGAFLLLVLPLLVPWTFRPKRRCPACGWSTRDEAARCCPRDATPLPG